METNNYTVYKHTFPNGKVYIGITMMDPVKRWNGGSGYRKQPKIYNAILYYGWRNIKHDILYTGLSKAEAEATEIRLIAQYNSTKNGYNVDHGGNTTGTHSEETKQKISTANKGKNLGKTVPEENKKRLSEMWSGEGNPFYGKHHTEEVKAEHAAFMLGNQYARGLQHTEDFKAWKSEQMHEKYRDGGNPRCKCVIGTDKHGNTVEYASLRIAAKAIGVGATTMHKYLHGGVPLGGYDWRFKNE